MAPEGDAGDGDEHDHEHGAPEPPRRALHRELALVSGFPDAIRILRRWAGTPVRVLAPWLAVAVGVALVLLGLVWLVGTTVAVDPTRPFGLPGRIARDPAAAMQHVFERNLVVLALHATACLAGFIIFFATREPPGEREDRLERATRITARVAFWFVPIATVLSIATQAWVLGSYAATAAGHLHMSVGVLLATTLPHALSELAAVFLPLAAWLVALRRRRLGELYAATIASVIVALPLLGAASWIEVHQWPDRVQAAPRVLPALDGVPVGTLVAAEPDSEPVELLLGPRISGRSAITDAAAIQLASEQSRRGGAVAVVDLGTLAIVHELRRRDGTGVCGDSGDGDADARPKQVDLDSLAELRFARLSRTIPGQVVELDVELLVQGDDAIDPERYVAPSIVRTLAAERCEGDAPAE